MIKTVAELFAALRDKELEVIDQFPDIKHPVMIGDMYEGLAKELMSRTIFDGFDLRVVDGKIRGKDGALTDQLDCMIVVGDGARLPHTEHYVYDIGQVVAVIEVKKALYAKQLLESFENLRSVAERADEQLFRRRRITMPFRTVTGVDVQSEEQVSQLPRWQQAVYDNIIGNALVPARIALGFFGYASEASLRQGFISVLESNASPDSNEPVAGFGPTSLPDVVVAGANAIVKLHGMPYAARTDKDCWVVFGSIRNNSALAMLEVIWYRLAVRFDLSASIFGEDLEQERVSPLIFATFREDDQGRAGWEYNALELSEHELLGLPSIVPWKPFVLDNLQFALVNYLCVHELIGVPSDQLESFCETYEQSEKQLIQRAKESGLIYLAVDATLRLNTDSCLCGIDPELGFVAAENEDGRFERWMLKRIAERKHGNNSEPVA